MRLMFYAPQHTGHHFAYLARMLPAFMGLPVEIVVATTPVAIISKEYERTLAPFSQSIRFVTCCWLGPKTTLDFADSANHFAETALLNRCLSLKPCNA